MVDVYNVKESTTRSIQLPEKAPVVSVMLDELYDVNNSTTGSVFTNFALRSEIEKEKVLSHLLEVFVACDKVSSFAN